MNQENNTVVNAEMLKKLKEAGLADGYDPVPLAKLLDAERLLKNAEIADLDEQTKQNWKEDRRKQEHAFQEEIKQLQRRR